MREGADIPPWVKWSIPLLLASLTVGCSDKVNVTSVSKPSENRPPLIIRKGPAYSSGPIDAGTSGQNLYVLVGDPDGLDNIAAVFLDVGSVVLHRAIARPGASTGFCEGPSYAALDTFDVMPIISTTYPGISDCPLEPSEGGYYSIGGFIFPPAFVTTPPVCSALPHLETGSEFFGPLVGSTCFPLPFYAVGVYPPAVASPRNIFITYADIEYKGISVTVYDAAGASATATFPDLRLVYQTAEERQATP